MENKILLRTPTDAFEAMKKALDHYIEKDYRRKDEAEKLRQSMYNFINKHYEVEDNMIEENKKYICENGAIVELIETKEFIAKSVSHEYLVEAGMDAEWDQFGHANEEGFNIVGEYKD